MCRAGRTRDPAYHEEERSCWSATLWASTVGAKELVVSIERDGARESGIVFTNDAGGHFTAGDRDWIGP